MAKQTIKQRKAIRSAAAKKGWETRRERSNTEFAADLEGALQDIRRFPPKPSLWQRIKRW